MSGGNQSASGARPLADAMSVIECRLVPPRFEADEPRVAQVLERALRPVRRKEAEHRRRPDPQVGERRPDGELRCRRRDLILDHHVEHRLLPRQVRRVREGRTCDAGEGTVVRRKRPVRWQRQARRDHPTTIERTVVLVELHVVRDPHARRVLELRIHAGQVEVARPAKDELEVADRLERHAHEEPKHVRLRLHERKHRHRRRDLVRERARRQRERQHGRHGDDPPRTPPHSGTDHACHSHEYTSVNRFGARDWTRVMA